MVLQVDELLAKRISDHAEALRFSGVVRVDQDGGVRFEGAFGLADRRFEVPNRVTTRMAIASGMKGITALTIMSLVESQHLSRVTRARELLGTDLPEIDDRVTVEHLLAHRSGIGDYLDESAGHEITDHVIPVAVHRLDWTEDYLDVLSGHPQVFPPGERFAYNNAGYVVLALLAERATGQEFHDLVERRVLSLADMGSTSFLRSDRLPGDAATGYLAEEGLQTNVLHLPLRGNGDGGVYSTVADIRRLWTAMDASAIVPPKVVEAMTTLRSPGSQEHSGYGLGFWVDAGVGAVRLVGHDAGVSFLSCHHPETDLTHTVISNWSDGTWPMSRHLRDLLHG